jgi:cytochrome c-type biogenesis protein CcmH
MMDTRKLIANLIVLAVLGAFTPARAVLPDEVMSDPAKEARARALSQELRCMVCQNQSIDDSEAPLARDLRLLVRERIASGDSDAQVIDFLVARYGEFVLLRPRFERQTLLLWLVPPLVLFGGGLVLWLQARRRKSGPGEAPAREALTSEEQARLQLLMADGMVPAVGGEKGSEARG